MQTYQVPFEIIGKLKIEAASAEEAQRIAESMRARDMAEEGDLETFEPEPVGDDD